MIRAGAVDVDGLDALGLPRVALRVARPTGCAFYLFIRAHGT